MILFGERCDAAAVLFLFRFLRLFLFFIEKFIHVNYPVLTTLQLSWATTCNEVISDDLSCGDAFIAQCFGDCLCLHQRSVYGDTVSKMGTNSVYTCMISQEDFSNVQISFQNIHYWSNAIKV
jgi:hypothetical protein